MGLTGSHQHLKQDLFLQQLPLAVQFFLSPFPLPAYGTLVVGEELISYAGGERSCSERDTKHHMFFTWLSLQSHLIMSI